MSDLLKDIYTTTFLDDFGDKVHSVYKNFNTKQFVNSVIADSWEELPLKARIHRISEVLGEYLPNDFEDALQVLYSVSESCSGFPYLFFPDFVETFGQVEKHFEVSMNALELFTKHSSSEFAIRPFLLREPERVMEYMMTWSLHPNEHVRRFSSEGCRPRLPWGTSLPIFKKDPSPVLKVLENLKADTSLYVRKSVANNLNDIAKDNPDVVLETVHRWIGNNKDTDWIIRKGCRTLIKKANPKAMALFGYTDFSAEKPLFKNAILTTHPTKLHIGDSCTLDYSLDIEWTASAHIRLEYGIDFIKSNGKPTRKIFLLSDKTVPSGAHLRGTRGHSFADLTTRRHYPGIHRIVLLVNGQEATETTLNIFSGNHEYE
jgi:3-methyladenine DNA glycosylase AlkC